MRIFSAFLLLGSLVLTGCGDGSGGGGTEPARVARVEVDPATATLDVGGAVTLAAAVYDQNGARMTRTDVAWNTEAPGVATVGADGRVQAVGAGSARIVATVAGVQGATTLTVQLAVTQVRIDRRYPSLFAGDTTLLAAAATRSDGSAAAGVAPAWTSSNTAVATVSATGIITAAAPGTATIRAAAGGAQDEVTVVVLARRTGVNREIAYLFANGGPGAVDVRMALPGESASTVLSDPERRASAFAWAPGGDAYVVGYTGWNNLPPVTEIRRVSGGAPVQVPVSIQSPDWAPDGGSLVYAAYTGATTDIYRLKADGTGEQRLTTLAGNEEYPQWSPDGRRIAFVRRLGSGPLELWVAAADGSGARQLATGAPAALHPRWSPDGKYLAFHSCDNVWMMDSEGLAPARPIRTEGPAGASCTLYNATVTKGFPAWSPDGSRLAFVRMASDNLLGDRDVETVTLDATLASSVRIPPAVGLQPSWPAWSPNGSLLAYSARRTDEAAGIGVARWEGAGLQWAGEPGSVSGPYWRP
jgi:hypothetical protein